MHYAQQTVSISLKNNICLIMYCNFYEPCPSKPLGLTCLCKVSQFWSTYKGLYEVKVTAVQYQWSFMVTEGEPHWKSWESNNVMKVCMDIYLYCCSSVCLISLVNCVNLVTAWWGKQILWHKFKNSLSVRVQTTDLFSLTSLLWSRTLKHILSLSIRGH